MYDYASYMERYGAFLKKASDHLRRTRGISYHEYHDFDKYHGIVKEKKSGPPLETPEQRKYVKDLMKRIYG